MSSKKASLRSNNSNVMSTPINEQSLLSKLSHMHETPEGGAYSTPLTSMKDSVLSTPLTGSSQTKKSNKSKKIISNSKVNSVNKRSTFKSPILRSALKTVSETFEPDLTSKSVDELIQVFETKASILSSKSVELKSTAKKSKGEVKTMRGGGRGSLTPSDPMPILSDFIFENKELTETVTYDNEVYSQAQNENKIVEIENLANIQNTIADNKITNVVPVKVQLSSEELELAQIMKDMDSITKKNEQHHNNYKSMQSTVTSNISSASYPAVKQSRVSITKRATKKVEKVNKRFVEEKTKSVPLNKSLTIPKTPNFQLNKRKGVKIINRRRSSLTALKKKLQMKSSSGFANSAPRRLTQVEPFKFATSTRQSTIPVTVSERNQPLSDAELAERFFRDPRSHYVPKAACKTITLPNSPKLQTTIRSKSATRLMPQSREEVEKNVMESQKPFKARPFDKRIVQSMGELGVPKVEAKKITETLEFEFRSDRRATMQRVSKSADAYDHDHQINTDSFKARPMPNFSSSGDNHPAVVPNTTFKPTVPISPKLSTSRRSSSAPSHRIPKSNTNEEAQKKQVINKDVGEFHLASVQRSNRHKAEMINKISKQLEIEKLEREVHANPCPDLSKSFQPAHHKVVTESKPFKLASVERHLDCQYTFKHDVEEEQIERMKQTQFKSRPIPKTTYIPEVVHIDENVPHNENIPPAIHLETESRAEKRRQFDENVASKLRELAVMQEQLDIIQQNEENKRLQAMRRTSVAEGGLVFKAAPILTTDPYPVKFTKAAPLTEPISPTLHKCRPRSYSGSMDSVSSMPLSANKSITRSGTKQGNKLRSNSNSRSSGAMNNEFRQAIQNL